MSGISAVTKVLVSYVNPLDVNAQVAMTIAEQLCRHGIHVDLRPVSRVRPSWVYGAVVLGGAIGDQHWDPAALTYLEQYGGNPERLWLFQTRFDANSGSPCLPPSDVLRAVNRVRAHPIPIFGAEPDTAAHEPATAPGRPGVADPHEAARRWASEIAFLLAAEDVVARNINDRRTDVVATC